MDQVMLVNFTDSRGGDYGDYDAVSCTTSVADVVAETAS